jgi:hypothetical protein
MKKVIPLTLILLFTLSLSAQAVTIYTYDSVDEVLLNFPHLNDMQQERVGYTTHYYYHPSPRGKFNDRWQQQEPIAQYHSTHLDRALFQNIEQRKEKARMLGQAYHDFMEKPKHFRNYGNKRVYD